MESVHINSNFLPSNHEFFKSVVENSLGGILILQNGYLQYANIAFCDLIGYKQIEILQVSIFEILPISERDRLKVHLEQSISSSSHSKDIYCTTLIHKNGSQVFVEFSVYSIAYGGNNTSTISIRNITDQKKNQEQFKQNESKYRNLVEHIYNGILICQFGKIKFVNPAFCNMMEYNMDELVEKNLANYLAKEDGESQLQYNKRRMAANTGNLHQNIKCISKSGRYIHFEANSTVIEYEGNPATFTILRNYTEQKILEDKLKASEQKYRALIEKSLDGIIIFQDSDIILVNQSFANMLGYSKEECLEKFYLECICPEDRDKIINYQKECIEGKLTDITVSIQLTGKNGKQIITEFTSTVIDFDERPASMATCREITGRINMQEALEKSDRKFRELSDLLPQIIYELDSKGFVTYVNKTGREIFNYEEGKSKFHSAEAVIPEDRERMKMNIIKALNGEKTSLFNEYTLLNRDGTTFPVIIYAAPVIDNEKFVGLRGLIVDITERKYMEEALRKSEEHYRHVIQSLQEGLFVIQKGKIIFINEAAGKIIGYKVHEMIGMDFMNIIPDDIKPSFSELPERIYDHESYATSTESVLLHKDGKTRVPVILSSNLTEFDGTPAIVGTAKDITSQKKAEEAIKAANKRLEEINRDLEKTIHNRTLELTKANTKLLKLQKENLQSQFDVLKQQVNPHFLFNSLNVLISLIRLEPDLAEKFTEHLAKVYRYVLENKDYELVTLSTEMSFLDAYLFMINIRFMDKVVVNITIAETRKSYRVIPLAMQLLIENAIKHNAMSKKSPLIIDIFIDEKNQLNIVNNLQERESHLTSTGVGLKNIQNRYRLLKQNLPVFEKTETHFIAQIPLVPER